MGHKASESAILKSFPISYTIYNEVENEIEELPEIATPKETNDSSNAGAGDASEVSTGSNESTMGIGKPIAHVTELGNKGDGHTKPPNYSLDNHPATLHRQSYNLA